jgi:hypothetical protein
MEGRGMQIILHLCGDIGSDSRPYDLDPEYEVIKIGKEIGVENYYPDRQIHGIIANPPCTAFSNAPGFHKTRDDKEGLELVFECLRIIDESNPKWWVMENPATGNLRKHLGNPFLTYQPWQYGSPWTKSTALWGSFAMPEKIYSNWEDVPKNPALYTRPGRGKPSLAFLHKSAIDLIPEFEWAKEFIKTDADFRSLCSQGFAQAFKEANP